MLCDLDIIDRTPKELETVLLYSVSSGLPIVVPNCSTHFFQSPMLPLSSLCSSSSTSVLSYVRCLYFSLYLTSFLFRLYHQSLYCRTSRLPVPHFLDCLVTARLLSLHHSWDDRYISLTQFLPAPLPLYQYQQFIHKRGKVRVVNLIALLYMNPLVFLYLNLLVVPFFNGQKTQV